MSSNDSPDTPDTQANENDFQEAPPYWNLDDPLKHAPPRPEGDPWETLLKPLLKNDKMRCDSWKDEVQNLLIFAGLFSAVVTAFIVESYKSLQPDPNDTILILLSNIAIHIDGASRSNSTALPLVPLPFSPTPSAVRVNTFWFISLVLSLTTVLVGIIALQWLREHQSYSTNLTSRQKYALFMMRADGLKTWHVPKIFTSLPLLLQSALILFFGGTIDFLHAIGHLDVTIPVTVIIGVVLIFLVATTILPWLQMFVLSLRLATHKDHYPSGSGDERALYPEEIYNRPPSQCPYKSPQARAVRNLGITLHQLRHRIGRYLRRLHYRYAPGVFLPRFRKTTPKPEDFKPINNLVQYPIMRSFLYPKWTDFDLEWVALRDYYMRDVFKHSISQRGHDELETVPIHDIIHGLREQSQQDDLFSAAYYSFTEISQKMLKPSITRGMFQSIDDFCLQSSHLHDLLGSRYGVLLPKWVVADQAPLNLHALVKRLSIPLHQQNVEAFLFYRQHGIATSMKTELRIRLLTYLFHNKDVIVPKDLNRIPRCLRFRLIVDVWTGQLPYNLDEFSAYATPIADFTRILLQKIQENSDPTSIVNNALVRREIIQPFLTTSAHCALDAFECGDALKSLSDTYQSIFVYIEEALRTEMVLWTPEHCRPSLFFYTSSVFAYAATKPDGFRFSQWASPKNHFRSMCDTICEYRRRTIDHRISDRTIEEQLGYEYRNPKRFSKAWWDLLDSRKWPNDALESSSRVSMEQLTPLPDTPAPSLVSSQGSKLDSLQ
ncbi:hypothetical protein JR316_0011037 [Psilocybe cubensis]|uniref:DUF6535 domain-containing protein n=2 Tax=Psilocybe cubensis TaxID=181762 RepID=A0A8H7XNV8_PSICU|nr:hypothetical protein JR316_0011037 [Psilocybe cubensis]KAH9477121.1 hypothetical protein JR316_0011037 [Psilocybe cubensis]